MGSKKLKAIVVEAQRKIEVADERKFNELREKYNEIFKESIACQSHTTYGTLQLLSLNRYNIYAKNEQTPLPEEMDILEDTFVEKFKVGNCACWMCPIGCSQKWEIKEGRFKNEKGEKIEFGHLMSLSWNLGLYDFPAALHLSNMTNRLGIDCIQFGWTLSLAMECWQRGILKGEDTDGLSLEWGDFEAIREMMEKVAYRKGFGSILAEGTKKAAQIIGHGAEEYAQHTKGLSFPYNADHILAMALANVVSARGADHLKGHPISGLIRNRELLEKIFGSDLPEDFFDRDSPVGKGRIVWWHENYRILQDSIGLCFIPFTDLIMIGDPYVFPQEFAEILNAVTGLGVDGYELMLVAERLVQIEKAFNAILGISRKDDAHQGRLRPNSVDNLNHPGMLDEYYKYRGFSKEGLPTNQRLREVGLEKIAQDLTKLGKISSAEVFDLQKLLRKIHQHQTSNVVVTVKLHSMIRDIVGRNFLTVELGEKATVDDLTKKISEAYPEVEKQLRASAIFRIEEKQLKPEDQLRRGDVISILMPVAGGLSSGL
jgi:aldehyde:ferredoxin oxidoreductase